jgi:predicted ester cyclase
VEDKMSTLDNKAILERALENFNRPESREAYFDLYYPDCTLHGYAGVGPGLEGIKQFYAGIWTAFPDAEVICHDWVTAGDQVGLRYTFKGTHQGDLMGIPPTGKAITVSGLTILRFTNGQCVERWSQTDFLGILQQVGAIPAPEQGS